MLFVRIALTVLVLMGSSSRGHAYPVNLIRMATGLNQPVGITSYLPTNQLLVSVNYGTGGVDHNFDLVAANGSRAPFGTTAGIPGEIKLTTIEAPCGGVAAGGFTAGDIFFGNKTTMAIYRIPVGSTAPVFFAALPTANAGDMISIVADTTGVFGGNLIVVTQVGGVFRITSGGVVTQVTDLSTIGTNPTPPTFEGVVTVPNDPRYGPWAGKIVVSNEVNGTFYAISPAGVVTSNVLNITTPESMALVPANKNLFIVGYTGGEIAGANAADFASMVGEIIVGQEWNGGLFRVSWDGSQFVVTQIGHVDMQMEQMTFSSAGLSGASPDNPTIVVTIPPIPAVLTASLDTTMLWPPNHDLVDVGLFVDACPNAGGGFVVTVYSNEEDVNPGNGDDRFSPDAKFGNGTLRLRSERTGYGFGRVYVIVVTSTSPGGSSQVLTVVVPHSQSAADIAGVNALAASALAQQADFISAATGMGSIPAGYFLVGDGPVIGPKQ
ncbi:MAG: hypothetical protein JWL77_3867 [Chthonomonadaceae bacterium]|nr:hypothetical protein [Chthonomonadaceae bacterium]